MNRIKLFGKVISMSDLKFDISEKLKVCIEFEISTVSSDVFKCIAYEENCNILRNVVIGEYIYILGSAKYVMNNTMGIIIENIMDSEILVIVSDVYF